MNPCQLWPFRTQFSQGRATRLNTLCVVSPSMSRAGTCRVQQGNCPETSRKFWPGCLSKKFCLSVPKASSSALHLIQYLQNKPFRSGTIATCKLSLSNVLKKMVLCFHLCLFTAAVALAIRQHYLQDLDLFCKCAALC